VQDHLAGRRASPDVLRGHTGLFYDYRELLKEIQGSYNPESQSTELACSNRCSPPTFITG